MHVELDRSLLSVLLSIHAGLGWEQPAQTVALARVERARTSPF